MRAEVGRSSQQKPRSIILADGDLRLGARLATERSGSQRPAIGTGAIPLRKPAAGGRAENFDAHRSEFTMSRMTEFATFGRIECRNCEIGCGGLRIQRVGEGFCLCLLRLRAILKTARSARRFSPPPPSPFIEFVPSFNPLVILSEGKDLCSFLAPGKVHRSPSTTLRAGFRVAQDDK